MACLNSAVDMTELRHAIGIAEFWATLHLKQGRLHSAFRRPFHLMQPASMSMQQSGSRVAGSHKFDPDMLIGLLAGRQLAGGLQLDFQIMTQHRVVGT